MAKRGRILRDTNVGPGMLTADGVQYTFTLEGMWRSDVPPRTGMTVDVDFNPEGAPQAVYAVSDSQLAKEQAELAFAGARRQGAALASGVQSRFSIPTLAAEGIMLTAFFVLPNLRIGNGFAERALNGWDALGLDPATTLTDHHGLLSLLAVLCLFSPLAVPFVRKTWTRWLYAAPFSFWIAAALDLYFEIENAGRAANRAMGDLFGHAATRQFGNTMSGMFSPMVGTYVVLVCALFLLTRAFKPTVSAA